MAKAKKPSTDPAELRRQAEDALCRRAFDLSPPQTAEEMQQLMHELQVHQMELELQNEELQRSHADIEAGLERYADLYDFAPISYLSLDQHGVIQQANLAAARLLGIDRSALAGRALEGFVPDEAAATFRALLIEVFTGVGRASCELEIAAASLQRFVMQIEALAVEHGCECRMAMLDVTERKRAEESLRKAHEDLTVANAELEQARDAAQAANRAKSAFLTHMSHEMRTPLNAIIGMTDLVLGDRLAEMHREYLDIVKDSANSLLTMVDEILDLSRLETGMLHLTPEVFDLPACIAAGLKPLAVEAQERGLQFSWRVAPGVPRWVCGDCRRLQQILVNLVQNAVKFTDRGTVALEVAEESLSGGNVVVHFTVSDTGIGIPQDRQAAIFEMFEQADTSLTRRHCGAGLGLSIASQLAHLMGGRIWVESEVGRGSCFHFTVRLGVVPENTSA